MCVYFYDAMITLFTRCSFLHHIVLSLEDRSMVRRKGHSLTPKNNYLLNQHRLIGDSDLGDDIPQTREGWAKSRTAEQGGIDYFPSMLTKNVGLRNPRRSQSLVGPNNEAQNPHSMFIMPLTIMSDVRTSTIVRSCASTIVLTNHVLKEEIVEINVGHYRSFCLPNKDDFCL